MTPDLSALRGLHLPAGGAGAVPGSFAAAVAFGFALALLVGLALWLRSRREGSVRRAALRELARAARLDPEAARLAQARLLRRLVRGLSGEEAAAGRGAAWAETLDRSLRTDYFTRGAGRDLVEGLYGRPRAAPADLGADLARLVARVRA